MAHNTALLPTTAMKLIFVLTLLALLCPHSVLAQSFSLPAFEQVRAAHVSSDALLLDRNGLPLADLRLNPQVRRLDWVPLTQLSPAMRNALLRAEDRRFFQHSGVDWLAFAGAAWQNLWGDGKRGASTLTMQLAGLLDPALRMPTQRRSYAQKWDQSRAAIELEAKWSKPQILEAYLNLAPFRGELQGIAAASELLFNLPASALTTREASLLAALLRGPNAAPPLVAKRACRLASTLGQSRLCAEITRLAQTRLNAPRNGPRHRLAPHLARRILQQPGQRTNSLLDASLQARLLATLTPDDDPQTAVLVLDNSNAEVLSWIGARDALAADGITLPRNLPDIGWPAAAALAIEQRELTAASPLALGDFIFDPRDAKAAPDSWVSLRTALLTRQPAAMLGLQMRQERELWHERIRSPGYESAPETLVNANLLQLAANWRSFAASGVWHSPRWQASQENTTRRLWRSETSYILQDMLGKFKPSGWQVLWSSRSRDDGSQVVLGHTERYTLALVTHNSDPLALWQRLAEALGGESRTPAVPEGVVCSSVQFAPPAEAARRECFLRGTELSLINVLPAGQTGLIRFPEAGQIYHVPADEPSRERWLLHAESSVALHWQLDGRPLGEGQHLRWLPAPGMHTLSIRDPRDRLLHKIEFEVRPAQDAETALAQP